MNLDVLKDQLLLLLRLADVEHLLDAAEETHPDPLPLFVSLSFSPSPSHSHIISAHILSLTSQSWPIQDKAHSF